MWKLVRSYFSLGEWISVVVEAEPDQQGVAVQVIRLKSPTIGIEPPAPTVSGRHAPLVLQRRLGVLAELRHVEGQAASPCEPL